MFDSFNPDSARDGLLPPRVSISADLDRADDTLARSREIGTLAHRAVANLAAVTLNPWPEQIKSEIDCCLSKFRPIERRAHRQNLTGAVCAYFWHLLPPTGWLFRGSEVHLGQGRVDLLWQDAEDQWLVDELKVGQGSGLRTTAVRHQVQSYITAGASTWGDSFVGVRLLTTGDPSASVFAASGKPWVPLHSTTHVRSI